MNYLAGIYNLFLYLGSEYLIFPSILNTLCSRSRHAKYMVITSKAEARENEITYLQSELCSLGVDCKRRNELNDKEELEFLAIAIKEVYYQDYRTAYYYHHDHQEASMRKEVDKSHFDYLI